MSQKLLSAIAPGTRLRIVNVLKRTQGLSVRAIAEQLGMSYMGVKDMCAELQKRGLVETWREPRPENSTGRPHLLYRLTARAHELFPVASNPLTLDLLEGTRKLHGPAAPEKLLLIVWQQKIATLKARVTDETLEARAAHLARLRDAEGHMSSVENPGGVVEHHCPFLDVLQVYPLVAKLEADLFSRVLGTPVQREETWAGGLYRVQFSFA